MADFDARSFRRFSTLRPVNEKRIDVIAARRMIPGEVLKYRSGLRWVIPRGQATTLTGSGGLCPTAPLTKLARQSANATTYLATNHSSLNNLDARVEIKEWIRSRAMQASSPSIFTRTLSGMQAHPAGQCHRRGASATCSTACPRHAACGSQTRTVDRTGATKTALSRG